MSLIADTLRDILTQPGHEPLEQLFVKTLSARDGQQEVLPFLAGVNKAASLSGFLAYLEPPQDQSDIEYIIDAIWVQDQNGIDPNDRIGMGYQDAGTALLVWFYDLKGCAGEAGIKQGTWWVWPFNIPGQGVTNVDLLTERPNPSFRVLRKPTGETWRKIQVNFVTTATVGTRTFNAYAMVRRRPSTQI